MPRSEPCDTVPVNNGGRGPGGHKRIPNKDNKVIDNGCRKEDVTMPDTEAMVLTMEALSAQLQEQTKLCKEQVMH